MSSAKGFEELYKQIRIYKEAISQNTKELVEYHMGEIEREAIRFAPGPGDRIKVRGGEITQDQISDKRRGPTPISQAIGYRIDSTGFKGTMYVDGSAGDLAIYVEMGTGQSAATYLADKSPEWKSLAMLYYVDGKGSIIAQPYILPAFLKGQLEFVKDMKDMLKRTKLRDKGGRFMSLK